MTKSFDPPEKRYIINPITNCWIWQGPLHSHGYGTYSEGLAHIYFYEKKYGKVPRGKELDHVICDNKKCCNPDHVKPVTHKENVLRSLTNPCAINARKTHCKRGHLLEGNNLIITKLRSRRCRVCKNLQMKDYQRLTPNILIRRNGQ